MARRRTASLSWSIVLLGACQSAEPCSDEVLQRGVASVEEMRAAHPLRIGDGSETPGFDIAARSIHAACPRIPMLLSTSDLRSIPIPTGREYRKALRRTCADLPAAEFGRRQAESQQRLGSQASTAALYEPCDLGRFGLADPVRFVLSGEGLTGYIAYDHMQRQGADPKIAAELAIELFWQSPWPFSQEVLAGLPSVDGRRGVAGIGLRLPSDAMPSTDEAIAGVLPELERARDSEEPARLIIVADADVGVASVAAIAAAARADGADEVFAMAIHPTGGASFVRLATAYANDDNFVQEACVDAKGAWWSLRFVGHSLLSSNEQTPWQRFGSEGPVLAVPAHGVANVTAMPSATLQDVLTALAAIDAVDVDGGGAPGVRRIELGTQADGCETWFGVLEEAELDARSLREDRQRCEVELARSSARRKACMKRVCEHARRHVSRFAGVPDLADRQADVASICARAAILGQSR